MIGIIGAMAEEVNAVLQYVEIKEVYKKLNYTFHVGTMSNHEVVVLQGGIGKVNTGIALTNLFEKYPIDFVINVGSAGGLDKAKESVGDVVIGEKIAYHDVNCTDFGYAPGQMPGNKSCYLYSDPKLIAIAKNALEALNLPVHSGLIASGDSFIAHKEQVEPILKLFPDALCSEMEAMAVAQVCDVYAIPFIITRSLSDVFEKGDSGIQFDTYLQKASTNSALMAKALVENYEG